MIHSLEVMFERASTEQVDGERKSKSTSESVGLRAGPRIGSLELVCGRHNCVSWVISSGLGQHICGGAEISDESKWGGVGWGGVGWGGVG